MRLHLSIHVHAHTHYTRTSRQQSTETLKQTDKVTPRDTRYCETGTPDDGDAGLTDERRRQRETAAEPWDSGTDRNTLTHAEGHRIFRETETREAWYQHEQKQGNRNWT